MNESTDWGLIAAALVGIGFMALILAVAVYEIGWGWRDFEDRIEQVPKLDEVPQDERGPAAMYETEHQAHRYIITAK